MDGQLYYCNDGTYQPNSNYMESSCSHEARAGHFVPDRMTGFVSDIPCTAGTYQDKTKQNSCKTVPAGHKSNADKTGIILCNNGEYQPRTGQTSCIKASRGFYVAETGATPATSQVICPTGTYQDREGKTGCIDAPAGYTAYDSHRGIRACHYGWYQKTPKAQTVCTKADPGYDVP